MFLGDRVRQARELRALTQEDFAEKIGYSKALVAQVEAGFKLPSHDFIESAALAANLPLTFFDAIPHAEFPMSEILLRARREIKRRQVLDTVRFAEHVFTIYSVLVSKVRPIPSVLPECVAGPTEAARLTRKAVGLGAEQPIEHLINIVERAGVFVIILPTLEGREGFSVWTRGAEAEVPIAALAADKEDGARYRMSMAHELGHLVMHKSFLRKSNKEVEEEAFTFAAEFLMPEPAMRKEIIPPFTLSSLARLKPRWGVSIAALVKRAHDLRISTTRQYHYLFQQLAAHGWRLREPKNLDVPLEKPRLLRKIAERAYGTPINYNRLSADVHVNPQELRSILSAYRGKDNDDLQVEAKVLPFSLGRDDGI